MTGFNWNGHDDCFRYAPDQFGGIEFHEDALADCGWEPTLSMEVPDVKSGVYAARLRAGDAEEHVVFFLRSKEPTASIAMLMPTCSYLAYANERIGLDTGMAQVLSSQVTVIHEWDLALSQRPEYGASCYDSHRDGAGRLLLHPAPADPQHAAQTPHGAHGRALAVPGRPLDHLLARDHGLSTTT